jgi:hypothetical protein
MPKIGTGLVSGHAQNRHRVGELVPEHAQEWCRIGICGGPRVVQASYLGRPKSGAGLVPGHFQEWCRVGTLAFPRVVQG